MILNLGCYGQDKSRVPPLFTVTGGTYEYAEETAADGTLNWELALLTGTNATLTFSRVVDYVDVFLVGGGAHGSGSNGGNGGTRLTLSGESKVAVGNSAYTFTIGGNNEATTIFDQTAESGGGSAGGRGAGASRDATKGADGEYAFGNAASLLYSGRKYGAGGGGGGHNYRIYRYGAAGGETGGGKGGSGGNGADGEVNTGSGGGGRYVDEYGGGSGGGGASSGAGGSGIIIIRNAR